MIEGGGIPWSSGTCGSRRGGGVGTSAVCGGGAVRATDWPLQRSRIPVKGDFAGAGGGGCGCCC